MANETLQLIITADNKEALKAIEDLAKSTSGLKTRFQEIKTDTNGAALALNNLSRVAQDAPYGFIGIANNINPLLESFQRLKDTTGSTTGAFKSMLSSLAGPAGIGLAVGALTSIIVAFGPKISQYIAQISEADMAQRKMNDSIAKATGSAQAEADKLTILNDIVKDSTLTTTERETALKQLQNTYKGNIELQKLDISDGEKLELVINSITEALKRKALAQAFATLIAEEEAKKARLQLDSLAEMRDKVGAATAAWTFIKAALTNASGEMASLQYNTEITNTALDKHGEEIGAVDKNINLLKSNLTDITREQIKYKDSTTLSTTALKAQSNEMSNYQRELNAYIKSEQDITRPTRAQRRKATPVLFQLNRQRTDKISEDVPAWYTDTMNEQTSVAAQDLETLNTQLKLSAELTSVVASGFNNVFETFVNGGDIGKALEESFKRIAIQLVEMVAQALIFKAILTALGVGATPLGAAALDSGMGFGGGGLLGQFLLRGSDLVLATQRANSNLTLRR
jgi:predicted DNA-binding antitoxin AbrB/MazE fold protein